MIITSLGFFLMTSLYVPVTTKLAFVAQLFLAF